MSVRHLDFQGTSSIQIFIALTSWAECTALQGILAQKADGVPGIGISFSHTIHA